MVSALTGPKAPRSVASICYTALAG